jgi:hypothetical protein
MLQMPDSLYCPFGLLVSLVVFILAVLLLRSTPRVKIFDSPEHVLKVWREARGFVECLLVLRLFARHVSTGVAFALLLGMVGLSGSLLSSLCGMSPEGLAVVRGMLKDVLDFISRLIRPNSPGHSQSLPEAG